MTLSYRATYRIFVLGKGWNYIGLKVRLRNDIDLISAIHKQGIGYQTKLYDDLANNFNYFPRNTNLCRSKFLVVENNFFGEKIYLLASCGANHVTMHKRNFLCFTGSVRWAFASTKHLKWWFFWQALTMVNISRTEYEIKS